MIDGKMKDAFELGDSLHDWIWVSKIIIHKEIVKHCIIRYIWHNKLENKDGIKEYWNKNKDVVDYIMLNNKRASLKQELVTRKNKINPNRKSIHKQMFNK